MYSIGQHIGQIGLVASEDREIADLGQWSELVDLNRVRHTTELVTSTGNVETTISTIKQVIEDHHGQVKKLSNRLKSSTLEQTLRNYWQWLFKHVGYRLDPVGEEHIKQPLRLLSDKIGDCDDYTVFIGSLLENQGIKYAIRKTAYDHDWQHVYIVVPKNQKKPTASDFSLKNRNNYYALDCVLTSFDEEKPPSKKEDDYMNIKILGTTSTGYVDYSQHHSTSFAGLGIIDELNSITNLSGLGSLGNATEDDLHSLELQKIREHLMITVKNVQQNPQFASLKPELPKLMNVLNNWGNKEATLRALDLLIADGTVSGLGGFFKKLAGKVKAVIKKVPSKVKQATKFVVDKAKDGLKAVVRYNPLSILIRNGLLIAFKANMFQMSQKLGYAMFTRPELDKMGFNSLFYHQIQNNYSNVLKMFLGLQGKKENLDKAIKQGWEKGVKKHNLRTLGEPVTATAATTAAGAFIAKIVAWLKGIDQEKLRAVANKSLDILPTLINNKTEQGEPKGVDLNSFSSATPTPSKKPMSTTAKAGIGLASIAGVGLLFHLIRSNQKEISKATPSSSVGSLSHKIKFSI